MKTLIVPSAQTSIKQSVIYSFYLVPLLVLSGRILLNGISLFLKKTLSLSKTEIINGLLKNWPSCSTLNHFILIGKYFLYCRALNNT